MFETSVKRKLSKLVAFSSRALQLIRVWCELGANQFAGKMTTPSTDSIGWEQNG